MGRKGGAVGRPAFGGKARGGKRGGLSLILGFVGLAGTLYVGTTLLYSSRFAPNPSARPTSESSAGRGEEKRRVRPSRNAERRERRTEATTLQRAASAAASAKYDREWDALPRDLNDCLSHQATLMTIPVEWPGFHALCIERVGDADVSVALHNRSGAVGTSGSRSLAVAAAGASRVEARRRRRASRASG